MALSRPCDSPTRRLEDVPDLAQRSCLRPVAAAAALAAVLSASSSARAAGLTAPPGRQHARSGMVALAGRRLLAPRMAAGRSAARPPPPSSAVAARGVSAGTGAPAVGAAVAPTGLALVAAAATAATAAGRGATRLAARGAGGSARPTDLEKRRAALEFLEAQRRLPAEESAEDPQPPRPTPMQRAAAGAGGPPEYHAGAPAAAAAAASSAGAAAAASASPAPAAAAPAAGGGGGGGGAAAAFSRIYDDGEWLCGSEARSGLGSRRETTREFCDFLEGFLRERGVTSVVDAGCGHWPSGYQRFLNWQGVRYHGVDVVPSVVQDNARYLADAEVLRAGGMASAEFCVGDVSSPLPGADLLLVKDVLMHLPTAAVHEFLRNNVSPRYRLVLVVQNEVPAAVNLRQMVDIEPGQLLPFDITRPPFEAPFVEVFRWLSDEPKTVQLWTRA